MFQVRVQGKEALEEPAAHGRAREITGWQSREGKACRRLPRLHYLFHTGNLDHLATKMSPAANINSHLSLQEAVVLPPYVAFAVRMNPGIWEYVKVHSDDLSVEGITPSEYLKFKETLYDENWYAIWYWECFKTLITNVLMPTENVWMNFQGQGWQLTGSRFRCSWPLNTASDTAIIHRKRAPVCLQIYVFKAGWQAWN